MRADELRNDPGRFFAGQALCSMSSLDEPFDVRGRYCARLAVFDATGRRTDGPEACSGAATCELAPTDGAFCAKTEACRPPSGGGCATGGTAGGACAQLIALAWFLGRRRQAHTPVSRRHATLRS